MSISISTVRGLPPAELATLRELVEIYDYHKMRNVEKARYYEGHISLREVNLGIALPQGLKDLQIGCEWGAKCVDVLASRSMFDGFVGANGATPDFLANITDANGLVYEYQKACRDELKFGAVFATLSADPDNKCRIRFHSPMSAAATWDGVKGRIGAGMAIIDTVKDEKDSNGWSPSRVNLYTDTDVWELERVGSEWIAKRNRHRMGRPLMEPMIFNATSAKPFGRSRLKEPVRRLIQGYVRTIANATIGLEFATSPQKYLLGVTDEQFDQIIDNKFKQYVGSILAATPNPETGQAPHYGQLPQGNIEPHVQMLRILATQFSAATGLTVTDTGVVNDANPTSSEAIMAQSQTLILMAEQLNAGNATALKTIALMAIAISENKSLADLSDDQYDVMPHFKNPAMPSVSSTADAALKIASAREGFAQTDTFLEMIGFSQADIRRIRAQEMRVRGLNVLTEEFDNETN